MRQLYGGLILWPWAHRSFLPRAEPRRGEAIAPVRHNGDLPIDGCYKENRLEVSHWLLLSAGHAACPITPTNKRSRKEEVYETSDDATRHYGDVTGFHPS